MTDEQSAYCEGCEHLSTIGGESVCGYAADTKKLRGCDVGQGCPHHTGKMLNGFRAQTRKRPGAKPLFDDEKARSMYDAGAKDTEIAKEFDVNPVSVANWRKKHGLPSWRSRERQERKMKKKLEITENGTELTTGRSEPCDPCTEQEREACRDCGHERDCVLDGAQQEDTEAGEYLPKERLGMTAEELAYVFERLGAAWPDCVVLVGERPVRRVRVSLCFDGEPEPSAKITLES